MQQTHVFTSAAFNYIPKVRMLFKSLRKHHPEWKLHLALADELRPGIDLSSEPFDEVIPIGELGIPSWRGWAFCHSIVELATAIKPFTLARLLKLPDTAKVIYLDPDTVCFSRLDDIVAALDESNIVLTPHQTCPEKTLTAVMDNEICSLKHGVYNLGFVAVAATDVGHEFADWWSKRIYHFCRADIPNGLFTDQRWIDLVPAFFDGVGILKSPRHNVAPWNLTTREMTGSLLEGFKVNGMPLGFYHFTGFDSGAHAIMVNKNANRNISVQALINWYINEISQSANDPLAKVPWAYGSYANGEKITPAQRLVYRERADLQRKFPDPFDSPESSSFIGWWKKQGKCEYPALFDSKTQSIEIARISSVLTPGYGSGSDISDWKSVFGQVKQGVCSPSHGIRLAKAAVSVLRRGGFSGLIRRIRNYS